VTAIGGRSKPELCFLPGRLRWTLLPMERCGNSLSGCGSTTKPSSWGADTLLLSYCRPSCLFLVTFSNKCCVMTTSHLLHAQSFDVQLLLREAQRSIDVISKIKQMRTGMLGDALISIENEVSNQPKLVDFIRTYAGVMEGFTGLAILITTAVRY